MIPTGGFAMLVVASASASAFVAGPQPFHRPLALDTLNRHVKDVFSHRNVLRASATAYDLDGVSLRGPLTPVEDTVVVKVDAVKDTTEGGLFLPVMKNARPTRGTVISAAEGKRHWDTGVHMPIKVSKGDRVVFGNFDGSSVTYQGSEHLLMRDDELLMTFKGDEVNLDTARMVGDRVLLRVKAAPKGSTTSAQGVLIAQSATRSFRPTVGVIEKVGAGRMTPTGKMMPMYAQPGDRVKFREFAAEYITIAGLETAEEELVVIRNVDILAKW